MKTISKTLLQNITVPLVIIEKDGKILESSETVNTFFEYPQHIKVKNIIHLLGDLPKTFKNQLNKGEHFSETIEVISRKGKLRWIRTKGYPHLDSTNLFQVTFDDVTEGRIQYDLAQQAKKIAKVGSWTGDLINNTLYWSNMTKEIHEVPGDYVPSLEKGINFYKEGESRERIVEAVSECIESGKPFDLELMIVTAKGNEKWVRAMGQAERANGKTVGFRGVFQDVDKPKRERMAYEIFSERLRVGINSANVGIWDFDVSKNELFWDDKMYELYGVKKSSFKGVYEAWEQTIHPEDKLLAATEVELAIKGKKTLNTEFRIIKQDGSIAFIHAEGKVFCDKAGNPYRLIGANTDVTKMKRRDQRLRHLLNITEKQNQRLLQFTNIVSHNLRSNSSNISMLAGMLNPNLPVEQQKNFIEMILTSSEQLDETIVQLNEIVKIQATDSDQIREIPLRNSIDKVIESVNGLLLEAEAKVKVKINKKLMVNGIKPYLTSVFINLITNSIKYRNPKAQLKIEISSKRLKNQTIISFKDNGLGIDLKKHRSKLFGMFKTFHNNADAKGVGLFITKNQMEAMNGKIEVESAINKGCTFHLYFMNQNN